jgi:hypothetical protein
MNVRPLLLALLITSGGCGAPARQTPQPSLPPAIVGKIWMHIDGDWVRPPADMGYPNAYGSAPATLLRFRNDHEFSIVQGWVIRSDNQFSISGGDPHRVLIGLWTPATAGTDVTYRLIYELVQPVGGGKYPGAEQKGHIAINGGAISFDGVGYEPSTIALTNYEDFVAPERAKLGPLAKAAR